MTTPPYLSSSSASRRAAPGSTPPDSRSPARSFTIGLARAVAGAVLFSLPLLMTMEMWHLGFAMDRGRLALLLVTMVPLLVGLSHVSGFEETFGALDDVVDAFAACAVGFLTSGALLGLFGVLGAGMSRSEIVGKVALAAVPASVGALLAQSQLGGARGGDEDTGDDGRNERRRPSSYWSQLPLMTAGALFLAFNVAPTEEMSLLAYMMAPWQVLLLVALSLLAMHGFVYAVEFSGQESEPQGTPMWSTFLRYTVVGYALAVAISAYVLWTFGRLDGIGRDELVATVSVLAFPASLGAAAARLIL